jgi:hypothetical protein
MYQLPLVPTAESMTPELAETMATVKTNMTAAAGSAASKSGAGSQARYFTMWERDSSGSISLAAPAAVPEEVPAVANLKRKASESCETGEDRKGSKGPFYLGDEDYGAAAARRRAEQGGREATVAEVP